MSDFVWLVFAFIFEGIFQWFFGHTGRLTLKALTLGRVDLDIDSYLDCVIAVIIGIAFWAAVTIGLIKGFGVG